MSQIKITRARRLAIIGNCPGSFAAMVEAIPAAAIAALSSKAIAAVVDANWQLASASKAIAARDAISEGGVWDSREECFRALAA